ncbi:MAG: hypothetical protein CMP49_00150 [Flavobacteriales bacterium]|nr:hypothetical protein [Flavobacteriales bacterium]|tara:strand:+ start:112 stop:477 length:366 start_codon:yes stop_codon:yes gene_type:complete
MDILIIINILISLTILNVWIVRYNKKTQWRGGEAKSLMEEFHVYGLPHWFMLIIGFLKISLALLLIVGLWIPSVNLYTACAMSVLMLGAIIMHLKVNDPIKKSLPALSILVLLISLISQSV